MVNIDEAAAQDSFCSVFESSSSKVGRFTVGFLAVFLINSYSRLYYNTISLITGISNTLMLTFFMVFKIFRSCRHIITLIT